MPTITTTKTFKTLNSGADITFDGDILTLRTACLVAIEQDPEQIKLKRADKDKLFMIGKKFEDPTKKEVTLSSEEISTLSEVIDRVWGTLVSSQVRAALDPDAVPFLRAVEKAT